MTTPFSRFAGSTPFGAGSLRAFWQDHKAFLALAAVFAMARFLAAFYLKPGGYIVDQPPDSWVYLDMLRLNYGGLAPYHDYWLEYPPILPWLLQVIGALALKIPPWDTQILVPNFLLRVTLAAFDIGNLALMYATARRVLGPAKGLLTAVAWALAFTPLMTFLGWYEPLALFFLLLAVYACVVDRAILAGVAMGLGFCVKVFPAVLIPLAVLCLPTWRKRLVAVGVTAAAVLAVFGPLWLSSPAYVGAWFVNLLGRGGWETVWALLDGYAGYGVVAPLQVRNDPAAAAVASVASRWPGVWITLTLAIGYLVVATRRINWSRLETRLWFALFSLGAFLLVSKGYSPQWNTYIVALTILALPLRSGIPYVLVLDLLVVVEFPIAIVLYRDDAQVLATVVILRTAVFALITLEAAARVWPRPTLLAKWVSRWAMPSAVIGVASIGLVALPEMWRRYYSARLDVEPLKPLVEQLAQDPQPPDLIVTQPRMVERLAPYVADGLIDYLPNGQQTPWRDVSQWMQTVLARGDRYWLVFAADGNVPEEIALHDQVQDQIEAWGCPVTRTWYGAVQASLFVERTDAAPDLPGGEFANGAVLRVIDAPAEGLAAGRSACVTLTWSTRTALDRDYTIFVHVLDDQGQLVAQSDLAPDVGTSGWMVDEVIVTRHGLVISPAAASGGLTLAVGLYDPVTGERLATSTGADAIRLTP